MKLKQSKSWFAAASILESPIVEKKLSENEIILDKLLEVAFKSSYTLGFGSTILVSGEFKEKTFKPSTVFSCTCKKMSHNKRQKNKYESNNRRDKACRDKSKEIAAAKSDF